MPDTRGLPNFLDIGTFVTLEFAKGASALELPWNFADTNVSNTLSMSDLESIPLHPRRVVEP